ncbi:hypothetical protein E3Q06_00564 [Wallemia mellicola]|nr:hypothetical protein E3Q21_00467 [Wallemia mellicola]TIB92495.1 hypothetical protein E3Q20_00214 [Wallemia mellicola]TIC43447.1 hypothetical protein E3Q07_00561 [Wallemia mellicola]TIC52351.1 hypothetical protein E3Q06_00564 [Wallemia mellicola]
MECSICYDSLINSTTLAINCGHVFHARCIHTWIERFRESSKTPNCPSCRYSIGSNKDLIKLHLSDDGGDSGQDANVEKLLDISKKVHALSLRQDLNRLRVTFDDVVQVISASDVSDEQTQKLLKVLSKELRGLKERLDQSATVEELKEKIKTLSHSLNYFETGKKKEISKIELGHTKMLSRISLEEQHLRDKFEKSLQDNEKLKKDYALTLTKKDAKISSLESNERRVLSKLSEREAENTKLKMNIVEWKKKYEARQSQSRQEKTPSKQNTSKQHANTPKEKPKIDLTYSSDLDMDSPSTSAISIRAHNGKKRKSDETLRILPPSDDVDDALDEPLPSFATANKKRATHSNNGPKLLSYSHNRLTNTNNIPSNSLLALGPKIHKRIPKDPINR